MGSALFVAVGDQIADSVAEKILPPHQAFPLFGSWFGVRLTHLVQVDPYPIRLGGGLLGALVLGIFFLFVWRTAWSYWLPVVGLGISTGAGIVGMYSSLYLGKYATFIFLKPPWGNRWSLDFWDVAFVIGGMCLGIAVLIGQLPQDRFLPDQ